MSDDADLWGGAPCIEDLARLGIVPRFEERCSATSDHGCGNPAAMIRIARGMPAPKRRTAAGRRRLTRPARPRRAEQGARAAGAAVRVGTHAR